MLAAGAGAGKTRLVLPVEDVGLKVPDTSGEPLGMPPAAASSSVTLRLVMVEVSPTPANGMMNAPVGPCSSKSVAGMSLELRFFSETVTFEMLPVSALTKILDGYGEAAPTVLGTVIAPVLQNWFPATVVWLSTS